MNDLPSEQSTAQINEHIKEFLKFNGYESTLECLQAEERAISLGPKKKQKVSESVIIRLKAPANPYAK